MKTIRAFIWGGAIGAVLGLLFAPQRGDVTRAQLQERFSQWQDQAQSQLGSLKETASGAVESGKKTVNSMRSQVQGMTSSSAPKTTSGRASLQDVTDRSNNTLGTTPTPSV
jgi:gas vesicle protein